MIRLADGREIKFPRVGQVVRLPNVTQSRKVVQNGEVVVETYLDDANFSEADLFKPDIMNQFGIKHVVYHDFDQKHFKLSGQPTEEEVAGTIHVRQTITRKMTPTQLAKMINGEIRTAAIEMYRAGKIHFDELSDEFSPIYDENASYVTEFNNFKTTLKTTHQLFKDELTAIVSGAGTVSTKYQALIDFTWRDRWPEPPQI